MPKILTRCPMTNEVVRTNLTLDAATYRIITITDHTYGCTACGGRHLWLQSESWPEGEAEPAG